jgi:hypothetical protein
LHDIHVLLRRVVVAMEESGPLEQPGLRRIAQRLRRQRTRAFARLARGWLAGMASPFLDGVRGMAGNTGR